MPELLHQHIFHVLADLDFFPNAIHWLLRAVRGRRYRAVSHPSRWNHSGRRAWNVDANLQAVGAAAAMVLVGGPGHSCFNAAMALDRTRKLRRNHEPDGVDRSIFHTVPSIRHRADFGDAAHWSDRPFISGHDNMEMRLEKSAGATGKTSASGRLRLAHRHRGNARLLC